MRWSGSTHGERLKSDKIGLNLAKKPAEAIWGYLWGHFWRLAAQAINSQGDVIVAASTNVKGPPSGGLFALVAAARPRPYRAHRPAPLGLCYCRVQWARPGYVSTWSPVNGVFVFTGQSAMTSDIGVRERLATLMVSSRYLFSSR